MRKQKRVLAALMAATMVCTSVPDTFLNTINVYAAEEGQQTAAPLTWNAESIKNQYPEARGYIVTEGSVPVVAYKYSDSTSGAYFNAYDSWLTLDETAIRSAYGIPAAQNAEDTLAGYDKIYDYKWYLVSGGKRVELKQSSYYYPELFTDSNNVVTYECDVTLEHLEKYDSQKGEWDYFYPVGDASKATIRYTTEYTGTPAAVENIEKNKLIKFNAAELEKEYFTNSEYDDDNHYTVTSTDGNVVVTNIWKSSSAYKYMYMENKYFSFDEAKVREAFGMPVAAEGDSFASKLTDVDGEEYDKYALNYSYKWYRVVDGVKAKVSDSRYYDLIINNADKSTVQYVCEATLNSVTAYKLDAEGYRTEDTVYNPKDKKPVASFELNYTYAGVTAEDIVSGAEKLSSYFDLSKFDGADGVVYVPVTAGTGYPTDDIEINHVKSGGVIDYKVTTTYKDGTTSLEKSDSNSYIDSSNFSMPNVKDGKEVVFYKYDFTLRYGVQELHKVSKVYSVSTDKKGIMTYFSNADKLEDRNVNLQGTTSTYVYFTSDGNDVESKKSSCARLSYELTAYDAAAEETANKRVVDSGNESTYLDGGRRLSLTQDFTMADSTVKTKQVDHYKLTVKLLFKNAEGKYEEVEKIEKTYKVNFSVLKGGYNLTVDSGNWSEKNQVVTFASRKDEKVKFEVNAYDDFSEGDVTYQWYKVAKDGTVTAIEGATSDEYYAQIDYTTAYKCVAVLADKEAAIKQFLSENGLPQDTVITPADYSYTFTPEAYTGYLLTDISDKKVTAAVDSSVEFYVKNMIDAGYTASYQWQKVTEDSTTSKTVFTDIKDATSNVFKIEKVTESDYSFGNLSDTYVDNASYRVVITIKDAAGAVTDTITYGFLIERPESYSVEVSENLKQKTGDYDYENNENLIVKGDDITFSLKATGDSTKCKLETVWYKELKTVDVKVKKDAQGKVVVENGKVVYEPVKAGETLPAATEYYKTKDSNERNWNDEYIGDDWYDYYETKTITYYAKIDTGADVTTLTLKGKNTDGTLVDTRGTYYVDLNITYLNEKGLESGKETKTWYATVVYNSYLKAFGKNTELTKKFGDAAVLEVLAENKYGEGIYPITYKWFKYDATKSEYVEIADKKESKLAFEKLTIADFGSYKAEVSDTSGCKKNVYFDIIEEGMQPKFYTQDYTYFKKAIGDTATLKVEAAMAEAVKAETIYTWSKSVKYINENDFEKYEKYWQVLNQNSDTYEFQVASEDDFVSYRCEVTYKLYGRYYTKTFYFNVADNSTIVVERTSPSTQYKKGGDSASYSVRVIKTSENIKDTDIKYQWFRYSSDKEKYEVIENQTAAIYTVEKLTDADFETLKCEVTYSEHNDPVVVSFYTNLYSDITLKNTEDEIEAAVGDTVTLKPELLNVGTTELTYEWSFYGEENYYGVIYSAKSESLQINDIGENQFGVYVCNIYVAGHRVATYTVDVVNKAEEKELELDYAEGFEKDVKGVVGKSVTLKVAAKYAGNLRYQWYYCVRTYDEDEDEWYDEDKAIGNATSDTYVIPMLTYDNKGTYKCVVESEDGKERKTIYFNVEAGSGLTVDSGYLYDDDVASYSTTLGSTVTLTANAKADETYTIFYQWYKVDSETKEPKVIYGATDKTLTLANVTKEDLGYYLCEVSDANYNTSYLSYYVYVNTGLVVEPSIYAPATAEDGSITMFVDARANEGETITYKWYHEEKNEKTEKLEWVEIKDATGRSYKLDKLVNDNMGRYRVEVSTSGETNKYDYNIYTRYSTKASKEYVEQGKDVSFEVKIINAPTDSKYEYEWYARDAVTEAWAKADCTENVYNTTAPYIMMGDSTTGYKSVSYRCYLIKDGEKLQEEYDEDDLYESFTVNVLPKVVYSTSLPKTTHPFDKRVDMQAYKIDGAKGLRVLFDAEYDRPSLVIDMSTGQACDTMLLEDGKYYRADVEGDSVVILDYAYNTANPEYEALGYEVASITNPATTVVLSNKTAAYTGKAVTINAAKVTGSKGAVTYTYYSDSKCTKALKSAPSAIGTYYVKANVEATIYHDGAVSNIAKLVIDKAASTVTLKAKTATYNGKAVSIGAATVKGSKGKVTYKYYSDAKCKKVLKKAPVNAGTYYVKASVAASGNYKAATSKPVKLTIKKAKQTISGVAKKVSVKYNKKKAVTVSLKAKAAGKITYKLAGKSKKITISSAGKIKVAKKTKKGNYIIGLKISAKATKNYTAATVTKKVTVTVK